MENSIIEYVIPLACSCKQVEVHFKGNLNRQKLLKCHVEQGFVFVAFYIDDGRDLDKYRAHWAEL